MGINLFGFQLGKKDVVVVEDPKQRSFALPTEALDDGAVNITQNAYYGTYVDLEGAVRNEMELITRYREMSNHPELESAISDITNEAISREDDGTIVEINLDNLEVTDNIKKFITGEYKNILSMLNFSNLADDLFKRWYIDGRLYFHVIVNETNPRDGIQELRYIDPRKIRKIREIAKERDHKSGLMVIKSIAEYYVYNERALPEQAFGTTVASPGIKIAPDSIVSVTSGLMDARNAFVVSYLNSAIKPLNQLRMIEDAVVIYRISRAAERRIFYVDVGNLPKGKAEQYLRDVMVKYRNKLVYNQSDGSIVDSRKHLSMLEDFFIPRRDGSKSTEITTLPGGGALSNLDDIDYFKKKLLQALHVPYSRLEPDGGGLAALGRTTEITRDELKFAKFIDKLRNRFSQLFDSILRIQLSLKGICTQDEWDTFREHIYYDYKKDNNFAELRESELLRERLGTLVQIDPYIGKYYSITWIKKNVLRQSDEEIEEINKEMKVDGSFEILQQAIAQEQPNIQKESFELI